jgi:hypothetical protein
MLSNTVLVITAWRRPEYLRQTLLSWAEADGSGQLGSVCVALGRSHLHDDMTAVITEMEDYFHRTIAVFRDSPEAVQSPGMHRALGEAIDTVFRTYRPSWVLCGEEDVVVSDDVLSYVEWAQGQATSKTLAICAHNQGGAGWDGLGEVRRDRDASQSAARRLSYFNPWVWSTSASTWRDGIRPHWDWDCTSGGGGSAAGYDWQMNRLAQLAAWHCIVPDAARSQTIGEFAGVYSTPGIYPYQLAHSFREHRPAPVPYALVE